ncbi:hypothetical protein STEG23_010203 [Scotinomys teguina]
MNCPVINRQLGSDTWLSLTNEHQINKSVNKSIRILVTKGMSLGSKTNKKIVSFDFAKGGYPDHLEDGYQFQPENLSLRILGNRTENEGWYFVNLEENVAVQQFCMQLKLYESSSWILHAVVPLGVMLIIIILVPTAVIMRKKQGIRNHCQPPVEEKSLTIYAQVQKSGPPEKKLDDALTDQDPCTTIYVAATEPAPEFVQRNLELHFSIDIWDRANFCHYGLFCSFNSVPVLYPLAASNTSSVRPSLQKKILFKGILNS